MWRLGREEAKSPLILSFERDSVATDASMPKNSEFVLSCGLIRRRKKNTGETVIDIQGRLSWSSVNRTKNQIANIYQKDI